MFKTKNKSQSITEYVALFMIVTAAIALTHKYVYRSMNARLKQVQEELDPASARAEAVSVSTPTTPTTTTPTTPTTPTAPTDPNCPGGVGCPTEPTAAKPTQQKEHCGAMCRALQIINRNKNLIKKTEGGE